MDSPWELQFAATTLEHRCKIAVARGLRAVGYAATDDRSTWPTWAKLAFQPFGVDPIDGLRCVRRLAEDAVARNAFEAAYALGGKRAARQVFAHLLEAQGAAHDRTRSP